MYRQAEIYRHDRQSCQGSVEPQEEIQRQRKFFGDVARKTWHEPNLKSSQKWLTDQRPQTNLVDIHEELPKVNYAREDSNLRPTD